MSALLVAACVVACAAGAREARGVLARGRLLRAVPPTGHLVDGGPSPADRWTRACLEPVATALGVSRRRDQRRLARGVPEALEELARRLRSGASLTQALAEIDGAGGAAGSLLAAVGRRALHGAGMLHEAAALGAGHVVPEVRAAAAALALAASGGASPALGVDAVAAGLRSAHAAADEARAHSAQARLSAAVLAVLPLAFTGWVVLTQPAAAAFLATSAPGITCLALGLGLEAAGVCWMAAILREDR